MILRRVMKHVRDQNWFAVAIDFLIVVTGVFIGIQVSNWNAERIASTREISYLQALGRDLEKSVEYADRTMEFIREMRAAQAGLADHVQGIRRLAPDQLNRTIFDALYPLPKLNVSMPTYEELKTSGATHLLKDRPLRLALQELDSRLEEVRQREADQSEIFYRFSDPYLIANFNLNTQDALAIQDGSSGNDADESRLFVFARQDPPADPTESLETDEFKNVLIYRFNADGNQLRAIRELKEIYVKIEEIVGTRLEKLGVEAP
jgi:hypothetical protein